MTDHPDNVTIHSGPCAATIARRGGGPSKLTWNGLDLLESYGGPGQPATAPMSANVVLAPWPNRTADGTFTFDGHRRQLDVTEPSKNTAIHGFVSKRDWTVADVGGDSGNTVRLVAEPGPQPGWPWPVHVAMTYRIHDDGLQADFVLRNDSAPGDDFDMPAACGFHLYPSALGAPTDTCTLEFPAHRLLPLDERGLPCGPEQDDAGDGALLPDAVNALEGKTLDHCFPLDAQGSGDGGVHRFVLRRPDGAGVLLETSSNLDWTQVFTPGEKTGKPYPGRPDGRAVAVEPMTAPPDALNSGTGLVRLPPGESLTCSWRLTVLPPQS